MSQTQRGEADGAAASDKSPLVQNAVSPPPLIADAAVFDNAAIAAEQSQETISGSGQLTSSDVDRKSMDAGRATLTSRSGSNKKRKVLSIVSHVI